MTFKIYTKKGDRGETGLYGGTRVSKDDLRIRTYGTVDELNSVLGLFLAQSSPKSALHGRILRLQGELFQLGAELATPRDRTVTTQPVEDPQVEAMEKEIDAMESVLAPLQTFILPGGAPEAALLHLARTVSRRAERELTTLHRQEPQREQLLRYLNRISDYLFVCARFANHERQVQDTPWIAPKRTS